MIYVFIVPYVLMNLSFKNCMNNNDNVIKGLPESSRRVALSFR